MIHTFPESEYLKDQISEKLKENPTQLGKPRKDRRPGWASLQRWDQSLEGAALTSQCC